MASEWIELNLPYGPGRRPHERDRLSFQSRGLFKVGTLIEVTKTDGTDPRKLLIGDMNDCGGGCDHCAYVDPDVIVTRYKVLYTPEELNAL